MSSYLLSRLYNYQTRSELQSNYSTVNQHISAGLGLLQATGIWKLVNTNKNAVKFPDIISILSQNGKIHLHWLGDIHRLMVANSSSRFIVQYSIAKQNINMWCNKIESQIKSCTTSSCLFIESMFPPHVTTKIMPFKIWLVRRQGTKVTQCFGMSETMFL